MDLRDPGERLAKSHFLTTRLGQKNVCAPGAQSFPNRITHRSFFFLDSLLGTIWHFKVISYPISFIQTPSPSHT